MITVIIHELGHAFAGLILLKGDISVYIGSYGDPTKGFHLKIGRLEIHIKYNLFLWNLGACVSNMKNMSLGQNYVFTLAGPLASLLAFIICIYLLIAPEIHNAIKVVALFLGYSCIQDFFMNIRPNNNAILLYSGDIVFNDGQTLKLLNQYRGAYKEITQLYQYISNKEIDKGIKFYEEIPNKNNIELIRLGIALYMKGNQFSKAIDLSQKLVEKTRLDSNDYCNYALAFSHSGDHKKALELYNKSLQINPGNIYSLNNKGYSLNILGCYEEAIHIFNEVIQIQPEFAYAYNNRGLSKIELGLEEEGLIDVQESMELDEENAYIYKHLGIYHKKKGELKKALQLFEKAKELDKTTYGIDELIQEIKESFSIINKRLE